MLNFHLRTSLAFLLVGFILGFCTSFLFTGCNKGSATKKEVVSTPKELKKEAVGVEQTYQKQIESLQSQNLQLQQSLEVTQGLLDEAKQAAKEKENKIKKIIAPQGYSAKELLSKSAKELLNKKDNSEETPEAKSICDSLVTEVIGYIQENHRKDSLYEIQLVQMDSVVTVKDDLIQANEKAYTNLNLLFSQSVTAQQNLAKENKLLQRQFKRQRLKNKLVTAGLMILSATATNYLLHH